MTYPEALERLFALRRFGVRPGLPVTRAALVAMGNPERDLAVIHIAGSNGKGSTAAFVASILRAANQRVGLYTSPHLHRFTERFRIDGAELPEAEAARLAGDVLAAAPEATFFEVATVMAFAAFRSARVDVAVLETGLGGRLDATNVVERPLATAVTGIALEHTEVLGATLEEIAREKAGIWKSGAPAIIGRVPDEARAVLLEEAARVGAPAHLAGRDFPETVDGPIGLAGAHQRGNAAVAVAAARLAFPSLDPASCARGLAEARWPGRLERIAPDVLLDAAHNADGARALAAALPAIAKGEPVTLVFGVVSDKDAAAMLAALAPAAGRVILTQPASDRALHPESLRALVPGAEVVASVADALGRARRPGTLTVVAGSIFLVAEARRLITGEPSDPIVAQDPPARKL